MDPHLTTLETGDLPGQHFFYTLLNAKDFNFEPATNAEILDWPISLN